MICVDHKSSILGVRPYLLPTSPLLPSPPLSPPLSPPPSLPSPSIPSLQTNLLLTLEVFPTDEAGVDIVVGEGDGTKLLKVKVKN